MYHQDGETILNEQAKVTKFDVFNEDKVVDFLENNDVDGIVLRAPARSTPAILDACRGVKAISGAGVGLDNIAGDYETEKGSKVLNAAKDNTTYTTEHAVSLVLAIKRDIIQHTTEM